MSRALHTALFAAIAVAAGLGVARAGPDVGPATLPIAGVVRDEQGLPIPAVWIEVEGHPRPLQSPPAWNTDVNGRFHIDDVSRGPATLLVSLGMWTHSSPKRVVQTRAGVRDLVIVLDPGPQLSLRIVDYVPGGRTRARVTWQEPDSTREVRYAPVRDDGWTRFVALPPDRRFEVWVEAELGRRQVRASGLKPGQAEQRIERHEVKDIAGKVRASEALLETRLRGNALGPLRKHLTVDVYAHPGFRVEETRVQDDGSFRLRGLPPGTYTVSVNRYYGDFGHPPVSKRVEAGTTDLVIDLEWDAMKTWGAADKDALVKKAGEGLADLEESVAHAKTAADKAGGDASRSLDEAWKTARERLAALKSASAGGHAKARDEMLAAYEALRARLGTSK